MTSNPNYWVVGATLSGASAAKMFLSRGYWQLGTGSKPKRDTLYMERLAQIKPGDRVAIKALCGKGTGRITVHGAGVVKDVVATERRVYIDWILQDISRNLDLNGCMDAINGPYTDDGKDKDWINEMFRI